MSETKVWGRLNLKVGFLALAEAKFPAALDIFGSQM